MHVCLFRLELLADSTKPQFVISIFFSFFFFLSFLLLPRKKKGNSNSSEEEVTNFYQFWFGYTTTYAFASGDKWDIREAPDRRIRCLMEKENKKLRDGQ